MKESLEDSSIYDESKQQPWFYDDEFLRGLIKNGLFKTKDEAIQFFKKHEKEIDKGVRLTKTLLGKSKWNIT